MLRFSTGRWMRAVASNRTRSPMAMRPESGSLPFRSPFRSVSPAMQSSIVVLPAPDAPKTMVKPGAAWKSTSSTKPDAPPIRLRTCAYSARDADLSLSINGSQKRSFPVHAVDDRQHGKADQQQKHRSCIGRGIVRSLHLVEDFNRNRAGHAGNISAHHQDYSEFSHGVRERQDCAGDESGLRKRNRHAKERFQWRCAERGRCKNQLAIDA